MGISKTISKLLVNKKTETYLKFSVMARLSKGVVAFCVGVFCLIVSTGNVIDFDTNFQFVQHVLSMDTLEPWFQGADEIGWRAITSPTAHLLFYSLIIAGEFTAGVLCTAGAYLVLRNFVSAKKDFYLGKSLFLLGGMFAIMVWYFGFCIVGSEWFAMWTSTQWNAQKTAYAFATYILLSMGYMLMPDPKDKD